MVFVTIVFVFFFAAFSEGAERVKPAIFGGEKSQNHGWPWMADIRYKGRHLCGGSLLNKQWILTAAHCIFYSGTNKLQKPSDFIVLLGTYYTISLEKNDNQMVSRKVKKLHYYGEEKTDTELYFYLENDIGLMKLDAPVKHTFAVQPVKLPLRSENVPLKTSITVIGWGVLYNGDDVCVMTERPDWIDENQRDNKPDELYQITMVTRDCGTWKAKNRICANEKKKDVCGGDSGGPLFIKKNGEWVQYGIVSAGPQCKENSKKAPGLYTNVSKFIKWITKLIQ